MGVEGRRHNRDPATPTGAAVEAQTLREASLEGERRRTMDVTNNECYYNHC